MKLGKLILFCNFIVLISWAGNCLAQQLTIKVKDVDKKPFAGVSVQITKVDDSTTTYNITDLSGIARFSGISNTLYLVKLSYVGFQTLEKSISVRSELRNFDFMLKKESVTLGEVTVTAQRPLIRQEDDKMIIDPLPLVNTSTNTLEVLEKVPGLYVDQDGGIYLTSTSQATIYINGREQKMSTQDIATLLRSLQPGSVEKIEVLRTPSTKYDAASSGGIINIVLKKGMKVGRFGTISAGMNQGFYGNQFGGFSFNTSGDKSTSYLNANYNHNDMLEEINSVRYLMSDTTLNQSSHSRQQSHNGALGYGINFDASEKINLSYDGRLNASFPKSYTDNSNHIEAGDELLLSENYNYITNNSQFWSTQQDFGAVWKIDTIGSNLDTKLSYSFNNNNNKQNYLSDFTLPFVAEIKSEGENLQRRHFIILQSDLTFQFPHKIKMETGIKSSFQYYTSNTAYFINQNGYLESVPMRTNVFNYQENINAAYIQASKTFGRSLVIKAGVRMEHTFMKGHQTIPADTSFIINRADWFPYIYISRTIIKILNIELKGYIIYRRTISRPGYQNLTPYIKYVDEFLYETGNPGLKPQFTDNYEINISYEDTPLLAFGQNFTRDIFSSVVYQDKTYENIAVRTYDNLGKNTETYFRLIVGIPPGKKYFFAVGAQYNYNNYNGVYESQKLTFSRDSWRIFTFHSLTLFKHTKITLFGFMMINGQQNFYMLKNFGQLNIGLNQSFFKNKLNISINARDILRTMVTRFEINQGSIDSYGDRYTDNQRFGINIRYTFGISKKEDRKGMMPYGEEE